VTRKQPRAQERRARHGRDIYRQFEQGSTQALPRAGTAGVVAGFCQIQICPLRPRHNSSRFVIVRSRVP
jgi:hypothetical protein